MGLDIIVEEVELAEPKDDEVRLKIQTCTICHSDIHALTGEHGKYEGPGMAGHEIAGIVDKIGSKVTYVKPGDGCCAPRCARAAAGATSACTTATGIAKTCPPQAPNSVYPARTRD
jgi:Zn-dependent alcohol dehydrogenase